MYRAEYVRGGGITLNQDSKEELMGVYKEESGEDEFITSGNGVFPTDPAVSLEKVNGNANLLCCCLNPDDSLLVTGGADASLNLVRWGLALAPGEESSRKAVEEAVKIPCGGPPICCAFAQMDNGRSFPVVAAGCMDGSVRLAYCGNDFEAFKSGEDRILLPDTANGAGINENGIKHSRYVKTVCWSPSAPILASASADGTIQLTRVGDGALNADGFCGKVAMEVIQSVHFDSPVEAMCFLNDGNTLCCYVRGTSYLTYFDLKDGFKQTKYSLNGGCKCAWCVSSECLLIHTANIYYKHSQLLDQFALMSMYPSQYCRSSHLLMESILLWLLICRGTLLWRLAPIES